MNYGTAEGQVRMVEKKGDKGGHNIQLCVIYQSCTYLQGLLLPRIQGGTGDSSVMYKKGPGLHQEP